MENHYCLFYKNDRLDFGWIKEVRKNKIVVVPEQGKEFTCAPSRVEYIWKGKSIPNEKEALAYLSDQASWSLQQSEKIELDVIHELSDPGVAYSLDELAENFLDDYENGWMRTALLLRLKSDGKLFQQRKSEFVARSEEELQGIENQERKRVEAEKLQEVEQNWANLLRKNEQPELDESNLEPFKQFLYRMKNVLIYLDRAPEKEYFCKLFGCHSKDLEVLEYRLIEGLENTEEAISWGKVILSRSAASLLFDDEEIEAANSVANSDIWVNPFQLETKDLIDIKTYTVDNEDTKDFDDALSFEQIENGYLIRVFITDVASFIAQDNILFEKASDRISSLYTLKEIYPMFPHLLSERCFSLVQDEERSVLVFEFSTDLSFLIQSSQIYRAVIKVDKNLSYQEVDAEIENETSDWKKLSEFCKVQADIRKENGSLELDRKEIKLDISDPENIKIKTIRQDTPASLMIQELAILTNHHSASYAKSRDLPSMFRNQPPYSISKDLPEGEKPTLRYINIQPARVSLSAEGHSALGLDSYLQITSPIRRFLDLVNQGILMSALGNLQLPYSNDQLLSWARRGEEIQKDNNLVERKLLDHWKLKYLDQNRENIFDAQVIRIYRSGRALINIDEVQFMVEANIDGVEEGEDFKVVIDSVDSKLNHIVIRQYFEG